MGYARNEDFGKYENFLGVIFSLALKNRDKPLQSTLLVKFDIKKLSYTEF